MAMSDLHFQDKHFEVHKALRLPRNLRFEVHKVLCLPRNLHLLRGSQSAAPATKSALGGSQIAVLATNSALRGSQNAVPATKSAHRVSPSAAPATKSALQKVLRVPRNLQTSHMSKSHDSLHLSRNQRASKIVTVYISKSSRSNSLHLSRKVTIMSENVHGATTRAQSRQALCAVEMHFEDLERHECTVNSSELAGCARATPRI